MLKSFIFKRRITCLGLGVILGDQFVYINTRAGCNNYNNY